MILGIVLCSRPHWSACTGAPALERLHWSACTGAPALERLHWFLGLKTLYFAASHRKALHNHRCAIERALMESGNFFHEIC